MTFINKWRIALIVGVAALAIPIAARVSTTEPPTVTGAQATIHQQSVVESAVATANHTKGIKVAVGRPTALPQDYYDRRREYWEDRMEGRADYLEEEDGNDDDSADKEDSKDSSKAEDDESGSMDEEEELVERRREYWRDRLERDW